MDRSTKCYYEAIIRFRASRSSRWLEGMHFPLAGHDSNKNLHSIMRCLYCMTQR